MHAIRPCLRSLSHAAAAAGVLVLSLSAAIAADAPKRSAAPAQPAASGKIQVLLVTGAEYHNWRETAPVLARQLQIDPRIKVRTIEDAHLLASLPLDDYQVILLNYMNWKMPSPGEAARANLKRAIEGGKGLVLVHFACGAWQDWPEFVKLAGRVWDPKLRGHDPHGKFRVEITDAEHPITKGLKPFETVDELYTCLTGKEPIHVLATATSKVDHKVYPMAFVLQCGKGRVFHCVLGHDAKALDSAAVGELYRRGTAWAAGQSPVCK
jgi:uncharacterized protein